MGNIPLKYLFIRIFDKNIITGLMEELSRMSAVKEVIVGSGPHEIVCLVEALKVGEVWSKVKSTKHFEKYGSGLGRRWNLKLNIPFFNF
ncbi:hypothetical protein ACFLQI_01840 [Candidatus Undinarchaeota archaeon]